jgi:hypothetical protein
VITGLNLDSVRQNQDAEKRLLCRKTERRAGEKERVWRKKRCLWRKCEKRWRKKYIIMVLFGNYGLNNATRLEKQQAQAALHWTDRCFIH